MIHMRDYKDVDISALTVDDALNDSDWGKQPADTTDYFAFDLSMLRLCCRLSDYEMAQVMRAVCDYVTHGIEPDYDNAPTVIAIVLESVISAHERRVNKAYLNSYKAYVKGKQKGKTSKLG